MSWFEVVTGFAETSPEDVRRNIIIDGTKLTSLVNNKSYTFGRLEVPSLNELRGRAAAVPNNRHAGKIRVKEVIADVSDLHAYEENAGAVFQVASQFNLLEMAGPDVTPERGVGIYGKDHTQGPACAIAAGAGTIYRNYFAEVNGIQGQSSVNQIDCLSDIGAALGNDDERLWKMKNGYALASREGLMEISAHIKNSPENDIDMLRGLLRVGIQSDTQVTIMKSKHTVIQVYCAALPAAYCSHPVDLWEDFAKLILEAAYEASVCTAVLNQHRTGNSSLFLTMLGGGVFGNRREWITQGIFRALKQYRDRPLEVSLVSLSSKPDIRDIVSMFT